ncbi:Predicted dithiol-disulfide isomerase, DsbA family [Roseomonas rosea]|uniref:Predicted dithiol-disulfide isomerase, DsbA family n=1 Tax=Muricoccus roseus TaxID=198092 RepID=A0A1M6JJA6_9PROT|nr:DsbA family oxidoreductase [Roseomonas rosea]SHJ46705.1 Predicted dithiol-disulfide isomerase, DsbA family [Roseomonas rosea]
MNALTPPRARLPIEVVFDLVCPWCFLGTRRLRRALRARPELVADLMWRPFLLNPDQPASGRDAFARRPGGADRARRLHTTLAEMGRAEGVPFRFDLIHRTPPSLDAHRLVRLAARRGVAEEVVDRLFLAHFAEGADIADHATLAGIAAAAGLDRAATRRFLAGDQEAEAVQAENLRAHRLGINGVPCFVLAGRHAIAGAQEPEVLQRLLDVAQAEAA